MHTRGITTALILATWLLLLFSAGVVTATGLLLWVEWLFG
jgi:hypothetical protein